MAPPSIGVGIDLYSQRALKWSPRSLSGLALWLRADQGLTTNDASFPSQDFTTWTKSAISVVGGFADPLGGSNAYSLVEDSTTGSHYPVSGYTNPNSGIQGRVQFYAKAGSRSWTSYYNGGSCSAYFNLGTGTLGTLTNVAASMTAVGNGWYFCRVDPTALGTQCFFSVVLGDLQGAYAGNGSGNLYMFAPTVEQRRVVGWADPVLGRSVLAGAASTQPVVIPGAKNGWPAIRFDGVDDYLKATAFTLAQPESLTMVYRQVAFGTAGVHDILADGNTAGSMTVGSVIASSFAFSAGSAVSYSGAVAGSGYECVTINWNGASSPLWTQGVQRATGNVGANNAGGFTLGALGNLTRNSAIEVAELMLSKDLAQRAKAEAYASAKYSFGF